MKKIFWMLVFIFFILPWGWFPCALDMWEDKNNVPKFVSEVIKRIVED